MRRLTDLVRGVLPLLHRGIRRVNARIAILAVVILLGGLATWQAVAFLRRDKSPEEPAGPTRQIATGPDAQEGPTIQQAGATLTDDQLPGGGSTTHGLMGYGQSAITAASPTDQPSTNPYLPSAGDSLAGYGAGAASSRRTSVSDQGVTDQGDVSTSLGTPAGGYGGTLYGPTDQPPPTAVPSDPTQSVASGNDPPNPYRTGATASLSDDTGGGYGPAGGETASETGDRTASPIMQPPYQAATTGDAAANNSGYAYGTSGRDGAASAYGDSAGLRPNALPSAGLSASPYADALRTDSGAAAGGGASSLNPYPSSSSASSSLPSSAGAMPAALPQSAGLASPAPGQRQLEGPQQPALAIEKHAPAEIQIGKPATFTTIVRNTGRVPAHQVAVTDHVPNGTQFVSARPQPQQASDGSLVWAIGTLQPGEETQIIVEVMPQEEGEIGSTANVTFAAAATTRSICTRPQLAIEHVAPPKVLIGETLKVAITVNNPGSGPTTGVVIEEDVPPGLSHAAGSQLEYEIGTLRPGEAKRLELLLKAEQAGVVQNTIVVRGDGGLTARHTVQLEVVAPQLQVAVEGPKVRFLERQATYTVQIANPGTAAARDVELVAFLPRGMRFVQTNSQGQYDASRHAIFWSLAELPPAQAGTVQLTALPVEPGEQKLRIESRAALGLTAASEQIVQVQQSAELLHTVKDLDDVIEVGSETTYEIRVTNVGTKAATQVRVTAQLPPGMTAISGEGPTRVEDANNPTQVAFEPLARLNPQEEVIFKVHVRGDQPGDHIVRVQLSSDEWETPVTREESTRVYQDR